MERKDQAHDNDNSLTPVAVQPPSLTTSDYSDELQSW